MMKLKGILLTSLMASLTMLVLGGCSSSAAHKEKNVQSDKNVTFVKDSQKDAGRIWFLNATDSQDSTGISKDININNILYVKNGKITVYDVSGAHNDDASSGDARLVAPSLKEFNNLSNSEIITKAKKMDKNTFKNTLKYAIEDSKDPSDSIGGIEDATKLSKSNMKVLDALKYEVPTTQKVAANVFTDDSGNKTKQELIHVKVMNYFHNEESEGNIGPKYLGAIVVDQRIALNVGLTVQTILKDKYIGYQGNYDNYVYYLITKTTNKNAEAKLDKPTQKGITNLDK